MELAQTLDLSLSTNPFSPLLDLNYKPHLYFEFSTPRYSLKIVNRWEELVEVFKLRQDVFFGENSGKDFDYDDFDQICDHVIVIDKETNTICGTYRVLLSSRCQNHYSSQEFDLSRFLSLNCEKMELGRASISPEHRNGQVLDLLWKGILTYATMSNSHYMFGCSSLMTLCPDTAGEVYDYLNREGVVSEDFSVEPTEDYSIRLGRLNSDTGKKLVPPLLRSYLNAGGKVYGKPAIDRDFGCFDFLTVLKISDLTTLFKRRYLERVI